MTDKAYMDQVLLPVLPKVEDMVVRFISGELVLGERQQAALLFQIGQLCDYCDIPWKQLYGQRWSQPRLVHLVKEAFAEIKRKLEAMEELETGLSATIGSLDGCWHTLVREGKTGAESNAKKLISNYLSRLEAIQKLLVDYVLGNLVLDNETLGLLGTLTEDYFKFWGIQADLISKLWARPAVAKLVECTIPELRKLIVEQTKVDINFAATVGDLAAVARSLEVKE